MVATDGFEPTPVIILSDLPLPVGLRGRKNQDTVNSDSIRSKNVNSC